ncbi:hypothetical protein HY798_00630 [Candidatus Falkowbacteria bacterium]|nr:hypothetical protein [Candidatus Falkowbacteria bacterium]
MVFRALKAKASLAGRSRFAFARGYRKNYRWNKCWVKVKGEGQLSWPKPLRFRARIQEKLSLE